MLHVCRPQGFGAPLLEADDPPEELEETHEPALHVWLAVVQSAHGPPAAPHVVSAFPGWHVPVGSQQPLQAVHDVAPPPSLLAPPSPPASSATPAPLLLPVADALPSSPVVYDPLAPPLDALLA
jgi:hypothetical protein